MADDDAEEEIPWMQREDVSELSLGKLTLFCCLSCGVPFAFPDDSYLSQQPEAVTMIKFTHFVRKHLRTNDRSMASTLQWHLNKAHYIHSFLHTSTLKVCLASADREQEQHANRKAWADQTQFLQAANDLLRAVHFKGGSQNRRFKISKIFLDYKSPWCNACNIAATHDKRLKELLGIPGKIRSSSSSSSCIYATMQVTMTEYMSRKAFPNVPNPLHLPLGMRTLHDAYLFIYIMGACISVILSASVSKDNSSSQFFRLESLVRLYIGYLLFQLTEQMNAGSIMGRLSFEHW